MKMFSGCIRLRELHARNNRLSMLLELAVYMRQMRRLIVLDLRANPICSTPGYKDVVINTFPILLDLDDVEIDPVEQRTAKMEMTPDVVTFATRRLLRLLYVEQLSRARVPPSAPPADTTEVPLVVLVGYEAETTRAKFDEMLLAGEFLTYEEMDGESYLLTLFAGREEACIRAGKVRIACMDLPGALMLKLRGRLPYLILA
ncbi:Leucine Rich Repeat family protein, partial [Operophtera brumata]